MKRILRSWAVALVIGLSASAASAGNLEEVPVNWRAETYTNGDVVAWGTSATCGGGRISLPPGDADAIKDRFWSLVLTAKSLRKRVGVFYDEANGCRIVNFYMKEGD